MKRITLLFLFITQTGYFNGIKQSRQLTYPSHVPFVQRGTFLMKEQSKLIDSFSVNGKINLQYLRATCNFLTDNDITTYNGNPLPRRTNALIRHVKFISEGLEEAYQENRFVNSSMIDLFYELAFYKESLKQKAWADAHTVMTTKEKINLAIQTNSSTKKFLYKNCITDHEAKDVDSLQGDPVASPFWHPYFSPYYSPISSANRFDKLAQMKKIKAKMNMVVLFDKPSLSGSSPKIDVLDLDLDNKWSLKWGDEVHTDVVGSHIFAALGYDVDHPYYYGQDMLTLVFDGEKEIKNVLQLKVKISEIYKIDLTPFITSSGLITPQVAGTSKDLKPFIGKQYVRFVNCVLEGRPDRVKRLGSFLPDLFCNEDRRELRGSLLAHEFIGNWDTREENTLLTLVHTGDKNYQPSAVFSDLGTSFGVAVTTYPADFKVGLVNEFPWEVATVEDGSVWLNNPINSMLPIYEKATYQDLLWMANKIATIDSISLRFMVNQGKWPQPISELYFHKLASRRASILKAFNITDLHPITFDQHLTIKNGDEFIVKDGILLVDYEKKRNPESFLSKKGRFSNYGY
jgi:hypothetical protein